MGDGFPKILVCGMPRSMTTWAFNVLRELVAHPDGDFIWIGPGAPEEASFARSHKMVLAKCHHFTQALAAAADVVIYSYRDLRTAAVSYHRKFGSPCTREMIDNWVAAQAAWLAVADIVLRYEDVEREPAKAVSSLRALLARKIPGLPLSALDDAQILVRVDQAFSDLEVAKEIKYSPVTMILPSHRTFQPEPEQLSAAEKALYDRVGADFSGWLGSHGYIEASDLGQELEYRIAAIVLRAFERPTVIDVGVERGSFVDLALRAGARMVIGYEPLPRHFEHLAARYAGELRVHIHPLAISNTGGTAQFHVATDAEGRELDYHHSLGDLGDSPTIIRSQRTIEVRTAALGALALDGLVPANIDFLKIDTDGHDLTVLNGLGELRPLAIMAEYWDTLPESSGRNPFTLADLAHWARSHGYQHMLVVRRHGRIELVQHDAPWTIAGDWGNVFFFSESFDFAPVERELEDHSRQSYEELCGYVSGLMRETEAKEAEIRTLDAGLQEARKQLASGSAAIASQQTLTTQLVEKEAVIQGLLEGSGSDADVRADRLRMLQAQQENKALRASTQEKELVIQTQDQSITRMTKEMQEKEAVIQGLLKSMAHAEDQHQQLLKGTQDSESRQRATTALLTPEVHALLVRGLEEKEAVIQEMKKALNTYRSAFALVGFFARPITRFIPVSAFSNLIPRPRLGTLHHHDPQDLVIPRSYSRPPALARTPRISLVTPSFRQAHFIERTINSVLDQKYPNLEYFVQDGGSDDGTREILERYADRLAGWKSEPDSGQSQAINLGFAQTSGEIMAWLNSDDVLLPGTLHCVADYFNRNPGVDVIYGHRMLIDENDRLIGRWILPGHDDKVLSWADYIPQETLFWRRSIWDKAGGTIDESFRFAMDWDLLLRFRQAGARFARIDRFMGGFRIHPHQKTSAAIGDIGFKEMDRLRERSLGRLPSHPEIRRAVMPYLLRHVACEIGWRIRAKLGAYR